MIRPWVWMKISPQWRIGVRPDKGYRTFSERYGFTRVWRAFGYAISFRRDAADRATPFFFGGWK